MCRQQIRPRQTRWQASPFHDRGVSVDNTISCASCHDPKRAFADGRKTSSGVGGKAGARNAPTVLNAAYATSQFWDGRAGSLEDQSAGPINNPLEMNQGHDVFVAKLRANAGYRAEFEKTFGPGPVTMKKVQNALASFERTLLSGNSAFDRYRFGGDAKALTPAAARGLSLFSDPKRGNCTACHTIDKTFALFTDNKFHNLGVGLSPEGEMKDLGRFEQTKVESDRGAFRTPMLRNVALTAPYMHDGSLATLRDVIDFYMGGGNSNDNLDKEMKPVGLSSAERGDLIAFLQSLTGEMPN
ncbi:MAG: cytochrome c peroxidase [Bryobacteraceae bacterium]